MDDANVHELVIIKRVPGGDHDEHHGGAWKIAFADFMTAMMALFLVLWLTSANEKTKAVIAHYFNPVRLVDSTPQRPGLADPKPGMPSSSPTLQRPSASADGKDSKEGKDGKDGKDGKEKDAEAAQKSKSEAELFKNPYAVLAELAAKNSAPVPPQKANPAQTEGERGGSGAVGTRNGEAYRDPFEPLAGVAETPLDAAPPKPAGRAPSPAAPPPGSSASASTGVGTPEGSRETADLRNRIEAAAKAGAGSGPNGSEPRVEVRHTDEGILIGLTDSANFSMFASASAEPVPAVVALMAKIGRILKTESGKITIRGFTDNHPFRSETYDNWRLSSARAHMAHYMLVRGGLDELRVERIEGFADRRPKNPKDPGAAENRRIEILLRETSP